MKITKEKAEIIGLLCSEGCHINALSSYWEYSKNRKKYYFRKNRRSERVEFSNTNVKLLKHFQTLIFKEYGIKNNINFSSQKVILIRKNIVQNIVKYSDYGYSKWKVPREVFNGSRNVQSAFIRGLYEGDGTKLNWRGKQPYIDFHMYNMKGLKKLIIILKRFEIDSKLYPTIYRLIIKGESVRRFAKIIRPKYRPIVLQGNRRGT